jgi:uncharacterized protein YkwD
MVVAVVATLAAAALLLLNPSSTTAAPTYDGEEQAFLTLLNNYRAQNGKAPLVSQIDLDEAADWYATDMATKNYYGGSSYCAQFGKPAHCDSLGRMPAQRVQAFGYPQSVGENIAAGYSTAQAVFNGWKASSGHNANMLGSYKAIGIGRACNPNSNYGCYWVTDFGFYTGGAADAPADRTADAAAHNDANAAAHNDANAQADTRANAHSRADTDTCSPPLGRC